MAAPMQTIVINKRAPRPEGHATEYIGRPSIFGNPHAVGWCDLCGTKHDRDEAIKLYRKWFRKKLSESAVFSLRVEELRGKALICYCAPQPCHGDVIVEHLNNNQLVIRTLD